MIFRNQIITDLEIHSVKDLYKLKPFLEDSTLKINKSQIARELEVDRRTVDKYINGYQKPATRKSSNCITPFYDIIAELLSDTNQQVFYYRKVFGSILLIIIIILVIMLISAFILRNMKNSILILERAVHQIPVRLRCVMKQTWENRHSWTGKNPFLSFFRQVILLMSIYLYYCFPTQDTVYIKYHSPRRRISFFPFLMKHLKHLEVYRKKQSQTT